MRQPVDRRRWPLTLCKAGLLMTALVQASGHGSRPTRPSNKRQRLPITTNKRALMRQAPGGRSTPCLHRGARRAQSFAVGLSVMNGRSGVIRKTDEDLAHRKNRTHTWLGAKLSPFHVGTPRCCGPPSSSELGVKLALVRHVASSASAYWLTGGPPW